MKVSITHQIVLFKENIPAQIFLQRPSRINALALPHWHHSIEINYVKKGSLKVMVDSEYVIVNEGESILINSSSIHATDSLDRHIDLDIVTVIISYDLLKTYFSELDQYYFILDKNNPHIKQVMLDIDYYYEQKDAFYNAKVSSLIHELVYTILKESQHIEKNEAYIQARHNILYAQKAIEYIDHHFKDSLTLSDVALKVGLSPEYFSRYFKKVTGDTFLHFLNRKRVIYAKNLIEREGITIAEATFMAGLPNEKTFRRVFKELYGMNPKEFFNRMSKIDL